MSEISKMPLVEFIYEGITTIIQCNPNDKLKDIFLNFANKTQTDINKLVFLYSGGLINGELTFLESANSEDKLRNKMSILVNKIEDDSTIKKTIIKSKEIICPKCLEISKLKIKNYKVKLFDCKNNHQIDNIYLKEFEKTQNMDISKIVCNKCNQNKANIYQNKFYICSLCKINLCPTCIIKHEHKDNIIDYEQKNYICQNHNDNYNSFCKSCKVNICMHCENEHKDHDILYFGKIIQDFNYVKNKAKELRKLIDNFNLSIKEIINLFNNVSENLEKYYSIYNNIINNIDLRKRNYEMIYNLNVINNDYDIFEDLKNLINNENLSNKFSKILEINKKMNCKKDLLDLIIDHFEDSQDKDFSLSQILKQIKGDILFETEEFNSNNYREVIIDNIKNNEILKSFLLKGIKKYFYSNKKLKIKKDEDIFSINKKELIKSIKLILSFFINKNILNTMINNTYFDIIINKQYFKNLIDDIITSNSLYGRLDSIIYNGFFIPNSVNIFNQIINGSFLDKLKVNKFYQNDISNNNNFIDIEKIELGYKSELKKQDIIKYIYEDKEVIIRHLFLEDYFRYYIIKFITTCKTCNKSNQNLIKFLKLIAKVKLSNGKDFSFNYSLEELCKIILFTQSYKTDIMSLLTTFLLTEDYCKKIQEIMMEILNKDDIIYLTSFIKRTSNNNFFLIFETLLRAFIIYSIELINKDKNIFYKYLSSFYAIITNMENISNKFNFFSNEISNVKTIINTQENMQKDKFEIVYIKIVNNLLLQSNYVYENDFDLLIKEYFDLIKIIKENFGTKSNNYFNLLNNIFKYRYESINNDNFKIRLIEKMFENELSINNFGNFIFYNLIKDKVYKNLNNKLSFINQEIMNKVHDVFEKNKNEAMNKFTLAFNSNQENRKKYTLINLFIENGENLQNLMKMKNLININKLSNLLIKIYSHRITIQDAKAKNLKNEVDYIYNEYKKIDDENKYKTLEEFKIEYINKFFDSWNSIKNESIQYKCRSLKKLDMAENSNLVYFLVGDRGNDSKYLASAYENFIYWQNHFINLIINNNKNNGILNKYISQLEQETNIQDAKNNEIILINENIINIFHEIIFSTLLRKILIKNPKIINYNNINFDYTNFDFCFIEEELGKIILPGLKKFVDNINFMIYLYQDFQGENSSLLNVFNSKYNGEDLDNEEKNYLSQIIDLKKKEIKAIRDIYSVIIILINYIIINNYESDYPIYKIIGRLPKYIPINYELLNCFREGNEKNKKYFTINKLINIFEIFEELCWKDMEQYLPLDYKIDINEETKGNFLNYFKENNSNGKIITLDILSSALRKFISRNLLYYEEVDIKSDTKLDLFMSREDLWSINIADDKFEIEYFEIFGGKDICVGQCYELFNLIKNEKEKNSP